jgi:hypothetical protein
MWMIFSGRRYIYFARRRGKIRRSTKQVSRAESITHTQDEQGHDEPSPRHGDGDRERCPQICHPFGGIQGPSVIEFSNVIVSHGAVGCAEVQYLYKGIPTRTYEDQKVILEIKFNHEHYCISILTSESH